MASLSDVSKQADAVWLSLVLLSNEHQLAFTSHLRLQCCSLSLHIWPRETTAYSTMQKSADCFLTCAYVHVQDEKKSLGGLKGEASGSLHRMHSIKHGALQGPQVQTYDSFACFER